MKKRGKKLINKDSFFYAIGIFFIFLGVFSIIWAVKEGRPQQIIWLCYIGLIMLGIGFLLKKDILISSQLNILIIPILVWNIDFWYILTTGNTLWGITDYFFFDSRTAISNLVTLQHIYTIPLAFIGLYLMKIKRKDSWKISIAQMGIIFILGRLFTPQANNMNCIYKSCFPLINVTQNYWLVWIILTLSIILMTNFILNRIPIFNQKN